MARIVELTPQAQTEALLREAPHNLEAEQALLGAILANNDALHHIPPSLRQEHFYAEVHGRIYDAIQMFHNKGLVANPVTLKHHFNNQQGVEDQYLARLVAAADTIINVSGYAQLVIDLALKRSLIGIGEQVVNTAYSAETYDSAYDQIEQAEQALFDLATEGEGADTLKTLRSTMIEVIHRAEAAYKRTGQLVGTSTGLRDLDKMLGGLQRSDLLILAGRPSMGKTALATTIAFNAARALLRDDETKLHEGQKPRSVAFFSLEMSAEQLANRVLAGASGINSSKITRGELQADEFPKLMQSSQELAQTPFFIDDTPAITISALRTRARRLKRVHNLGVIVVDYLQLVRPSSTKGNAGRVQEISEITQGLKAIAKELDVPVLALSQLSRAVEQRDDKRPQLSDLRESGSIEQDADVVMFVFREEYYLERQQPREGSPEHIQWQEQMAKVHHLAEVLIAKQRNGPIGKVVLHFEPSLTRFDDHVDDSRLPEQRF